MIVYFPRGNFPVIKFPIGNNNTDVPAGLRVVVVWELLKVALSMGNSKIWFGVLEYDCADATSSVAEFSVGTQVVWRSIETKKMCKINCAVNMVVGHEIT